MALKAPDLNPKKDFPDFAEVAGRVQKLAYQLRVVHESGDKQKIASGIERWFSADVVMGEQTRWWAEFIKGGGEFFGDVGSAVSGVYHASQEKSIKSLFAGDRVPFPEEVAVVASQIIAAEHQKVLGGGFWQQLWNDPIGYIGDLISSWQGEKDWHHLRQERIAKNAYIELIEAGVDNDSALLLTGVKADKNGIPGIVAAPAYMKSPKERGEYLTASNAHKHAELLKEDGGFSARDAGYWGTALVVFGGSPANAVAFGIPTTVAATKIGYHMTKATLTKDLAIKHLVESTKVEGDDLTKLRKEASKILKQRGDLADEALKAAQAQLKAGKGLKGAWARAVGITGLRVAGAGVGAVGSVFSVGDSIDSFGRADKSAQRGDKTAENLNYALGGASAVAAGAGAAGVALLLFSGPPGWIAAAGGTALATGLLGSLGDDLLDWLGWADVHNNDDKEQLMELQQGWLWPSQTHGATIAEVRDAMKDEVSPLHELMTELKMMSSGRMGIEWEIERQLRMKGPNAVFTLPSYFQKKIQGHLIAEERERSPHLNEEQLKAIVSRQSFLPSSYSKAAPLRASDILSYLGDDPDHIISSPLTMSLRAQGLTDEDIGTIILQARAQIENDRQAWRKNPDDKLPDPVFKLTGDIGKVEGKPLLKTGDTLGFGSEETFIESWKNYHIVYAYKVKKQQDLIEAIEKAPKEGRDASELLTKARDATVKARQSGVVKTENERPTGSPAFVPGTITVDGTDNWIMVP